MQFQGDSGLAGNQAGAAGRVHAQTVHMTACSAARLQRRPGTACGAVLCYGLRCQLRCMQSLLPSALPAGLTNAVAALQHVSGVVFQAQQATARASPVACRTATASVLCADQRSIFSHGESKSSCMESHDHALHAEMAL